VNVVETIVVFGNYIWKEGEFCIIHREIGVFLKYIIFSSRMKCPKLKRKRVFS